MTQSPTSLPRNSMLGSLNNIKKLGLNPKTVIDVGAALGTFELYSSFPQAKHFLIEPVAENEPYLDKICQFLENAEYIIAAATSETTEVTLTVAPYLVHSSVAGDCITNPPDVSIRKIPGIPLDSLCKDKKLEPPYLLKIDVDGTEVDVLKGAVETLKSSEYVIIEVTLLRQMYDVMKFMESQGFVAYDMVELGYRPIDNALWQCDMAFVKKDSHYRSDKGYIEQENIDFLSDHLNSYRERLMNWVDTNYISFLKAKLELRETNFIIFPQWDLHEELLSKDLARALQFVTSRADAGQVTLLVDTTNVSEEDANLALSTAAMSLMLETEIDVSEEPQISLASNLGAIEWETVLTQIRGRIALENDNRDAIARAQAEHLPIIQNID